MTPKEAEEYVRARWKPQALIVDTDPSLHIYVRAEGELRLFLAWGYAADFTRQREEEIRQKREEIAWVYERISGPAVAKRIYAVLDAQLAALLVGWKEQEKP